MEKIVREATRCKEIIQGLLEFSRHMPSKMMPAERQRHPGGSHLPGGRSPLVPEHSTWCRNWTRDLPPVLGDKNRLEQVFINLLMNSGESMQGEGRLTVQHRGGPGRGPGAAPLSGHRPRHPGPIASAACSIPFFTTKEVGKGVGLGLSISYGIIQKHLGRIYVERTGPEGHHLCHRTAGLPGIGGRDNRRESDLEKKSTNSGARPAVSAAGAA